MSHFFPDADESSIGSHAPIPSHGYQSHTVYSENQILKDQLLILKDKAIQNDARLRSLSDQLDLMGAKSMETREAISRLEEKLAVVEEANSVAHVALMAARVRYLRERKKCKRYKAMLKFLRCFFYLKSLLDPGYIVYFCFCTFVSLN